MAAKSTNTKKSSTNNTAKAAKNATTKKTSTAKKASASTKKSSGSKTKRTSNHINTAQSQEIRSEILLLGSLAICILLILSNFGMGGIAGGAISSVGFGLVGAMAYLFPFVFFGANEQDEKDCDYHILRCPACGNWNHGFSIPSAMGIRQERPFHCR